jgi:hypothetical protein
MTILKVGLFRDRESIIVLETIVFQYFILKETSTSKSGLKIFLFSFLLG